LPVLTLTLVYSAYFARVQRTAVLEVLGDDVMRTATAKGVPSLPRLVRHGVRRAWRPLLTAVGLALPMLIGGAVFVERIFAWPGMGLILVNGIAVRDFPLVTATAILGSVLVVAGATMSDVAARWLDPRATRDT
jgi:peptide/nickel transport system permease protein